MRRYNGETEEGQGRLQIWITAACVIIAFGLNLIPSSTRRPLAGAVQASVLRPFLWTQERLTDARVRGEEAAVLQARLDSAIVRVLSQSTLAEENRRLLRLLGLTDRVFNTFVPSTVLRSGALASESMLMLDVGVDDGVTASDAIVVPEGLVGVVTEVDGGRSMGIDWTHPDFRASAMTVDGLIFGMVRSEALAGGHRLRLEGTPFQSFVPLGSSIVTSGRGGALPRGIPIAHVAEVAEEDAGWQRSYWLEPVVQPGAATHVVVLVDELASPSDLSIAWPPDSIRNQVESAALDAARLDSLGIFRDSIDVLLDQIRDLQPIDSVGGSSPSRPGGAP